MSHSPMETLQLRLLSGSACKPIGMETAHYRTEEKYRVVGHCILEHSDKLGLLYEPVHYPEVRLAADPDAFHRMRLDLSADDWYQAGVRLQDAVDSTPANTLMTHRKTGGEYRIIGHCALDEELRVGLLYVPTQGPVVTFARPLGQIHELVTLDGEDVPRFTILGQT